MVIHTREALMNPSRMPTVFALLCLPAVALQARLVAPPSYSHTISFDSFYPSQTGQIRYRVWMEAKVDTTPLGPNHIITGDPPDFVLTHEICEIDLLEDNSYYWHSPRGIFQARVITRDQALAAGVAQTQIDEIKAELHPISITYKESSIYLDPLRENAYPNSRDFRVKGTVVLDVDVPQHPGNRWGLKVISALAEERVHPIYLVPGQHKITITDIEAGNVLVGLTAAYLNGDPADSYFQETYALVRKGSPANITMQFAEANAADRYRIGYLGVGHNSQSVRENLPLQKGKDAMVRLMVYDAWGNGGKVGNKTCSVQVDWSSPAGSGSKTFDSHVSGYHTKSGHEDGSTYHLIPGPTIPGIYVQPGLTVTAKLHHPTTNQMVGTKTVQMDAKLPREITIHGYDVRPLWGSGCTLVRSNEQMADFILPFVKDVFPYSKINFKYENKVWLSNAFGLATGSPYLAAILGAMNILQGWHQTDINAPSEHLYMGMTHSKYGGTDPFGMAWYGYRGLAISRIDSNEQLGYGIAHEMGHCFQLLHAPSPGANAYTLGLHLNRVDYNYPYGGSGMAGGWGYSRLLHGNLPKLYENFLSEDSHTVDNGCNAHWDLMAYPPVARRRTNTRFSDYNARHFVPSHSSPPAPFGTPNIVNYHPGTSILVFGPETAYDTEQRWISFDPSTSSIDRVPDNNIPNTPLDYTIGTISDDPDGDGTGQPGIIVTRVPRIKTVTVDN
jgi:hypothetical protein